VLIYNGDADSCVPYKGNEEWTEGFAAQGLVYTPHAPPPVKAHTLLMHAFLHTLSHPLASHIHDMIAFLHRLPVPVPQQIKQNRGWHPWYVDTTHNMPAGYATTYTVSNSTKDFSFVTIRLAGHMVGIHDVSLGERVSHAQRSTEGHTMSLLINPPPLSPLLLHILPPLPLLRLALHTPSPLLARIHPPCPC